MTAPILITGASKRLGLALALDFIEKGQKVIATYRKENEGIETLFDKGATIYPVDFYDSTSLETLIKRLKEEQPRLRGIIHNASDWLKEHDHNHADVIRRMMQVHVEAPYRINFSLKENLEAGANPFADIIHISDYVATRGSQKHIAYAASKAAMENLGLSFATAYAPTIKVNNIAPALMIFNDSDTDEYKDQAKRKSLLAKEGGPEEFIKAVDYLLESQYITGQTLRLDGGRHLKQQL